MWTVFLVGATAFSVLATRLSPNEVYSRSRRKSLGYFTGHNRTLIRRVHFTVLVVRLPRLGGDLIREPIIRRGPPAWKGIDRTDLAICQHVTETCHASEVVATVNAVTGTRHRIDSIGCQPGQ